MPPLRLFYDLGVDADGCRYLGLLVKWNGEVRIQVKTGNPSVNGKISRAYVQPTLDDSNCEDRKFARGLDRSSVARIAYLSCEIDGVTVMRSPSNIKKDAQRNDGDAADDAECDPKRCVIGWKGHIPVCLSENG